MRLDRFTCLLVALAALGAGLVLARQATGGVGLSSDSVNYIGVARHLLAGDGFIQPFYSNPYHAFPPLYPLLLAATTLFAVDPYDVAGPVNAAIFGLTIFVAGRYLKQCLASRLLLAYACLDLVFSIPLNWVASWALSEPAFILLSTLALIQTDKFLNDGKRSALMWAGVFTAFACLTRYMGVSVISSIALLLLFQPGVAPMEKVKRVSAYMLIASAPLCLWMLRNVLIVGTPAGNKENFVHYSLSDILDGMSAVLSKGLFPTLPLEYVYFASVALICTILFALAIAVGYIFVRNYQKSEACKDWQPFLIFGGFALVYLVQLVVALATGKTTYGTGIQPRYLTPFYLPLLFATVFAVDRFSIGIADRPSVRHWCLRMETGTVRLLFSVLLIWLVCSAALTTRSVIHAKTNSRAKYAHSEVLQYIRENPLNGFIVSNIRDLVYIHNGGLATYRGLGFGRSDLGSWVENAADSTYIVWYYDRWQDPDSGYSTAGLRALPELELVVELADGAIFRVKANRSIDD